MEALAVLGIVFLPVILLFVRGILWILWTAFLGVIDLFVAHNDF